MKKIKLKQVQYKNLKSKPFMQQQPQQTKQQINFINN